MPDQLQEIGKITFRIYGGGNGLLCHLGALHRLVETYGLSKVEVEALEGPADWDLTGTCNQFVEAWKQTKKPQAGGFYDDARILPKAFLEEVRGLRQSSWFRKYLIGMESAPKPCRCELISTASPFISAKWSLEDDCGQRKWWSIEEASERRMREKATSSDWLDPSVIDYLVDLGYVLCDGMLRVRGGISDCVSSPNRLFYVEEFKGHAAASLITGPSPSPAQAKVS